MTKANTRKPEALRRLLVKCPHCEKKNRISKWIFVQHKYWYMSPDAQGGGCFLDHEIDMCDIICPACGSEVYICNQLRALGAYLKKERIWPPKIFAKVVVGRLNDATNRILAAVARGAIRP